MFDLILATPATPEAVWCDGGKARIYWARHTSHTYHSFFKVHAILKGHTPVCRTKARAASTRGRSLEIGVTGVAGMTPPAFLGSPSCHPAMDGATPRVRKTNHQRV
jgi:hypothetical protein